MSEKSLLAFLLEDLNTITDIKGEIPNVAMIYDGEQWKEVKTDSEEFKNWLKKK